MTGGADHVLRQPIKIAIDLGGADPDAILEQVLLTLSAYGVIDYRGESMALLSASGRVLVDIVRHPGTTLREVALRLGTTESTVAKQMTNLVRENLIQRTRVGTRNRYKTNAKSLLSHPDSASFIEALMITAQQSTPANGDSAQNGD
jgi:hypothetical protein